MTLRQARLLATKAGVRFDENGEIQPATRILRERKSDANSLSFPIEDLQASGYEKTDEVESILVTLKSEAGGRKTIRTPQSITYIPRR